MIVYVETNFLIELIRRQEEYASCLAILDLAESGEIQLQIPAYCFTEAREKVRKLRGEYETLIQQINQKVELFRRGETAQARRRRESGPSGPFGDH